jgi:MFS family permease
VNVERNDRAIVALVMIGHAMVHTYELSIPIFVGIWLVEFDPVTVGPATVGVTTATVGLAVTAGYALFGAGALPAGVLVDRIGSRRLIAACLFGMSISFFLLALSPGLLSVTVALLVWGAAASVYHPAGLTLISTGVEERGTAFAYHGIAGNIGIALGPLVATLLLLVLGWHLVAAALALPALLAGVYALGAEFDEGRTATAADGGERGDTGPGGDDAATRKRSDGSPGSTGIESLRDFRRAAGTLFAGSFVVVFAVVMCSGLYYRGVLTFLPGLLGGLPGFEPVPLSMLVGEVGADRTIQPERYVYSGLLVVGVAGQYVGGKLTDRVAVERGLIAAFSGLVLVSLAFPVVAPRGGLALLALCAVLGFVLFSTQPFYQATVAEYTPADARGLSYGFTYLGVFGVGALGGVLAGGLLAYADGTTLFLALALVAVLGATLGATLLLRGTRIAD